MAMMNDAAAALHADTGNIDMPSTSLTQFAESVSDDAIRKYFYSKNAPGDLPRLFEIAFSNKSLFPDMNLGGGSTYRDYLDRWIEKYRKAESYSTQPRRAKPKGSCNDPAVKAIVKIATGVSDEAASKQESHHNLFMSAENIQGALLEEYIASGIAEHGWIWCKGNVLRAVDFCLPHPKLRLLQVKNKSNSENSSSSSVRSGTIIEKWHRLGTKTEGKRKLPVYRWDVLNGIIASTSKMSCNLNESDYVKYVEDVARNNRGLITDQ